MSNFNSFRRNHDYLICVDSDGCVMDTMNCKHFYCFGPCLVAEWGLGVWQEKILKRWNEINLFSMTRGINRFKALAIALAEINLCYKPIPGVEAFQRWICTAPALSNNAVKKAAEEASDEKSKEIFQKVLHWSNAVNHSIAGLNPSLKVPYEGAKEGLAQAHTFADVAVVSSANREAVEAEWEKFGLLQYADIVLTQDIGTKTACVGKLLKYGYDLDKVIMVGDAPGDCDAAEINGVYYYPVLVNQEKSSWEELISVAFPKLQSGEYSEYGVLKKREFFHNLGGID